MTPDRLTTAEALVDGEEHKVAHEAATGVSRATLHHALESDVQPTAR